MLEALENMENALSAYLHEAGRNAARPTAVTQNRKATDLAGQQYAAGFTGLAAGMWGALRPVEQLQAIFGYRNAHLYPERVFLPQINNLLNASGRLKDAELLGRLKAQANGFTDFVERLKNVKLRGARL